MGFKKLEARPLVLIVSIDVGEERPGVDDQSDEPNSAAKISSIRSEMSVRPLAPAPAARSRLRPARTPRCASMASLVSSEIVVLRRCASWRKRASRSSDSFTVVRFSYASIPNPAAGGRHALRIGPLVCAPVGARCHDGLKARRSSARFSREFRAVPLVAPRQRPKGNEARVLMLPTVEGSGRAQLLRQTFGQGPHLTIGAQS